MVKIAGKELFVAVEKGVGKYKDTAFLLMKLTKRAEARVWIKENIRKKFIFKN